MKQILLFSAPWCGQCKVLHPQFEAECNRLGLEKGKDWKEVDADDEANSELISLYGIKNLPTLIFLDELKVVGRAYGVNAWQEIKNHFA